MKKNIEAKNILFDFDGTIMDTSEGIKNGFEYALNKSGRSLPSGNFYRKLIGPPLSESFEHILGFDHSQVQECINLYREYYAPKGLFEVSLYPGIKELLEELKNSGKRLCIASSKPTAFVKQLLEKFKLDGYFDFVSASDMNEKNASKALIIKRAMDFCKDKSPSLEETFLMVGDRKYDMEGAAKNSIPSAGALWGFGSRDELEKAGADICWDSPAQAAECLLTKENLK